MAAALSESQQRVARLALHGASIAALRMMLMPGWAVRTMTSVDLQFNQQQQKLVNELMRWCGVLFLILCRTGLWLVDKRFILTRDLLKELGWLMVLDGTFVKFYGFWGSGVISAADALGGGVIDISTGSALLLTVNNY
jgi:hypothetical protein